MLLPAPHESPWYPDPLINLLSSPVLPPLSSPPPPRWLKAQAFLFQPIATKQCLHSGDQSKANPRIYKQAHSHTHILRSSPEWSIGACLCKTPPAHKTDNLPVYPSCWSPSVQVFRYINMGRMCYSHACKSAGWVDLEQTLNSRWLVDW